MEVPDEKFHNLKSLKELRHYHIYTFHLGPYNLVSVKVHVDLLRIGHNFYS